MLVLIIIIIIKNDGIKVNYSLFLSMCIIYLLHGICKVFILFFFVEGDLILVTRFKLQFMRIYSLIDPFFVYFMYVL